MKKIVIVLFLGFTLISCSTDNKQDLLNKNNKQIKNVCENFYNIGINNTDVLNLKGIIISDNIKNVTSPMAGIIKYINCNVGKKVNEKTLIAQISPDYNNPNISNLLIQKSSLINQKTNLETLKNTTILNFDNQIDSVKSQIELINKNILLTKKSGKLSKNDLEKQIKALQDSLVSLENNLNLLKKSKKDALDKIAISRKGLLDNIKNISSDNLLKVDEIFGITEDNKYKNDRYEDYLGVKDVSILNKVKTEFLKIYLKDINNLSDDEISNYLGNLIELDNDSKNSIQDSIVNVHFPQTQIDLFYNLFLNYSKNITELKSSWDNLKATKSSTISNFDTQISSLNNQIKTTNTNLDNLKTNKIGNIDTANELQLSNLESQLKTLKSNLNNLISNKKTQTLNLDNQIIQLKQNISSLNNNLVIRNIYSGVSGVVKQKFLAKGNNVGPNIPICQIIPNNFSTKIKIYSPIQLKVGDKLSFTYDNKKNYIFINNALVYKDPITQNYIYESNYLNKKYFKDGDIINIKYKKDLKNKNNLSNTGSDNNGIVIPVSYVINRINGNFVKVMSGNLVIENKVILGDINGNMVEIKNGIKGVNRICK